MTKFIRQDKRTAAQLREVKITPHFVSTADGSCLIEMGGTRVICTASIETKVPKWLAESEKGWVTAEYSMLPASTGSRKRRPIGKPDSRSVEIQRLIGRALRSVVNLHKIPGIQITVDCDVLEADGGTRTASITGGQVALALAIQKAQQLDLAMPKALTGHIAAISVGIVDDTCLLDLPYVEDSIAEVDMNVAMTSKGEFIEIQGTSEGKPFTQDQLFKMLNLAKRGINKLIKLQKQAISTSEDK